MIACAIGSHTLMLVLFKRLREEAKKLRLHDKQLGKKRDDHNLINK